MKLDVVLMKIPLEGVADAARQAEDTGFDGVWMTEIVNDALVSLAPAAVSTRRVDLGTAVALAFVRSPMLTACASWELQRASRGRFILGLGTQVKAHNERRFSVPFESPIPKLAEQVLALRACWAAFAGETPLAFNGQFYRLDMLPPMFRPEPIGYPAPPVYLAALNETSYRVAGEVADGVHVHPFHSVRYLREVAVPAIEKGLAKAGRPRSDFTVSATVLVAAGRGQKRTEADQYVRHQLAFYGSTRTYRAPLELHGFGDVNARLHALMAQGDMSGLAAAVPDEVVREFSVSGESWEDVASAAFNRYEGVVDRVNFYTTPPPAEGRRVRTAFAGR